MAHSVVVVPETCEVVGPDLNISFKIRVNPGVAMEVVRAKHKPDADMIVVFVTDHLDIEPSDLAFEDMVSRARQTSWAQALRERLTGKGPRKAEA